MRWSVGAAVVVTSLLSPEARAQSPNPISPGSQTEMVVVERRCPTFDWTAHDGARDIELVIYRVAEAGSLDEPQAVLTVTLPGGASGWTPSLGSCLERGARYAWAVRATGAPDATEWSRPNLFRVAPGPSAAEFAEALGVVRAYLESSGKLVPPEAPAAVPEPPATPGRPRGGGSATPPAAASAPLSITPPDVAGVTSRVGEPTGVTFGLYGISDSADEGSSGVVGQSTAATGATFGVVGHVQSLNGVAGVFDNSSMGRVLSGRSNGLEVFSVDTDGEVAFTNLVATGPSDPVIQINQPAALPGIFINGASPGIHIFTGWIGATGLIAETNDTGGATIGVRGIVKSANGTAGVFHNTNAAGGLLSGLSGAGSGTEVFAVDGAGQVTATGFSGDGSGLTGVSADDADTLDGLDSTDLVQSLDTITESSAGSGEVCVTCPVGHPFMTGGACDKGGGGGPGFGPATAINTTTYCCEDAGAGNDVSVTAVCATVD